MEIHVRGTTFLKARKTLTKQPFIETGDEIRKLFDGKSSVSLKPDDSGVYILNCDPTWFQTELLYRECSSLEEELELIESLDSDTFDKDLDDGTREFLNFYEGLEH